jgi:hypothetical protein
MTAENNSRAGPVEPALAPAQLSSHRISFGRSQLSDVCKLTDRISLVIA